MTEVKTAVFPVAGFGTRFLPATKATPKVLLPIVDRPLIQYAMDEAVAAGIENFVFVTGRGNNAIEDYFDVSYELESTLRARGDVEVAATLEKIRHKPGHVAYVRQIDPLGLGHAVWCARNVVGNEPFAVLLADELILSDPPSLVAMLEVHATHGGNVVLVDEVPDEETSKYGIIEPAGEINGAVEVDDIVEKPATDTAPSNLAAIGRYILDPTILTILSETATGAGGEIQLTDALRASIGRVPFHAVRTSGRRFDCGSKSGFVDATIHVALQRDDMRADLQRTIDGLASRES
ncbi:MAG: UTP--glucose-1-phosphate uridylyltransferase GalU [Acidimicrobiia bacterium]|nr:MAG: UTP--glucose-1-phosphate uridylyltransferase GalU [Acidimicrobiia bacterium]